MQSNLSWRVRSKKVLPKAKFTPSISIAMRRTVWWADWILQHSYNLWAEYWRRLLSKRRELTLLGPCTVQHDSANFSYVKFNFLIIGFELHVMDKDMDMTFFYYCCWIEHPSHDVCCSYCFVCALLICHNLLCCTGDYSGEHQQQRTVW